MPRHPRTKAAAAAAGPIDLQTFLCFSVYAANNAFGRVYKPLLDPLGLTYLQYLVLVVLWRGDGLTVGEIGAQLVLESNTLTPLLKRLEAAGHLRRERDSADERQVRIVLTPQGRALQAAVAHVPRCVFEASGLDLPALETLRDQLVALRATLDAAAPRS